MAGTLGAIGRAIGKLGSAVTRGSGGLLTPPTAALDFSDANNSQYLGLV